jgi:serine protease AprX
LPAVTHKLFPTVPDGLADDFQGGVAIQQALEDGAIIANCSWGNGLATDGTSRLARAFDSAWDLGLILVKSAGNGGPGAGTMTSPAEARGVIVVGATNRQGTRLEDYSSRGPAAAKPGPDFLAPGGSLNDFIQSLIPGNRTGRVDAGTSFAAPHITGLIALLLEQDPNATPDQIKAKLTAQARPLNPNPPAECGAGLKF